MEMAQKEKIFDYLYKAALFLVLAFFIYSIVSLFFISRSKEKKLWSRVSGPVDAIKSNLKRAKPKKSEIEEVSRPSLIEDITTLPLVTPIEKAFVFTGPIEVVEEVQVVEEVIEEELEDVVQFKRVDISEFPTDIVFKGVGDGLVLINVRRKIKEKWHEQCFPIKIGGRIGSEKIIANKKIDFTTNCVLKDIVYNAQRAVTLSKKVVILDEEGGFVGTKIVPGETFMKTTSKMAYKDEEGNTKELWLGKTHVVIEEIIEEEKKTWKEDPVGNVKSLYGDVVKKEKTPKKRKKNKNR